MKSETPIFDFINELLKTELISGRPTYRNENYTFSNRSLMKIKDYLNQIDIEKQKEILSIVKEFNINQKSLFFENLKISAYSLMELIFAFWSDKEYTLL